MNDFMISLTKTTLLKSLLLFLKINHTHENTEKKERINK